MKRTHEAVLAIITVVSGVMMVSTIGCRVHQPNGAGMAAIEEDVDGVYMTCNEIAGFKEMVLELSEGEYRLWLRSDVVGAEEASEPERGTFSVSGDRVTLVSDVGNRATWVVANYGNRPALWKESSLESSRRGSPPNLYRLLIMTTYKEVGDNVFGLARPSARE